MVLSFEYRVLENDAQANALVRLIAQCFLSKPELCDVYLNRIGHDRFRAIYDQTQLVGGLALISMGQWWLGQRVPMTGIAAVGIAPEYRGSGAAIALVSHMLHELHAEEVPISVLYPATQRLYRKAGYEQGGSYCRWEVPLAHIHLKERSLPWQAISPSADLLAPIYQQKAVLYNGHLDRSPAIWSEILEPQETLFAYSVGSAQQPEGYILFTQTSDSGGAILQVRDWVALTPAAGQNLWKFVADHRSQVHKLRFQGAAVDPMLFLLPEQVGHMASSMNWLLRLVHVPHALEKRGYPMGLETELHLDVQDEQLPENQGRWTLAIAHGRGTITPGGQGALKVDIRALGALYGGGFSPYDLQRAGLLDGDQATLTTAAQVFTASPAWMPDFF